MTPEQKDHAVHLLQMGEKLEAVRYMQETLGLSAEQALTLVEKLDEETEQTELRTKFESMRERMQSGPASKMPRTVGLIFMSIGGIMLAVVAYIIVSDYKFSQRAVPVTGKVIDYSSYYSTDSDGSGSTMYTPTFEYTYNGSKHTYTSSTSSSSPDFEMGESVEILVDPDNPGNVLVNAFWERWLLAVILGFMGSMFAGLGYMAFRLFGGS